MDIALPTSWRLALEERLPSYVRVACWYDNEWDIRQSAGDAEVLGIGFTYSPILPLVEAAPRVRWICTTQAGVEPFPLGLLRKRDIRLTNGAGISAIPIAEFVVLCVLAAAKSFPRVLKAYEHCEFGDRERPACEVHGSRALIVGFGATGRAVGERLKSFGVDVIGVRRTSAEPGVLVGDSWKDHLSGFDWIILTAPLTPETWHIIGGAELEAMKSTAWIVNVARGGLIDQAALVEHLQAGRLGGAYLDVTEPEPLPSDHPLWTLPNVVVSGHTSARGGQGMTRFYDDFLANLDRFVKGGNLVNLVDLMAGY